MITLIGATGFTGRLVAKELAGRDVRVKLAARDPRKLAEMLVTLDRPFECVSLDVANRTSYQTALEGTDVVINCAGPFSDLGEPVLRETVARGIHYLDTTGEQSFIKLAFDKYGRLARETGSVLAPACAFEYAIGDAAAALLADRTNNCESIEINYSLQEPITSRGTKKSVIRALGAEQLELRNDKLVPLALGKNTTVQFPNGTSKNAFPFPGGEVLLVPLHLPVHSLTTSMTTDIPSPLLKFVSLAGAFLSASKLSILFDKLIDAAPAAPPQEHRIRTAFSILCRNSAGDSVTVKGCDPYLLTAMIISDLACHIENNKVTPGPVSPSMVAGYKRIVDITTRGGSVWEDSLLR